MKVEKYKIKDWENCETGLLIAENEDWILVKHIPVDYVIDGYKVYKKEFIEAREYSIDEKKIEKVLKLKKIELNMPLDFKFSDTIGLLKWIEKKYGVFEFQDEEETEVFYGKINRIEDGKLIIDMINSDGSVEAGYDYKYDIDNIRVLAFESDYHSSIRLLWIDKVNTFYGSM